MAVPGFDKYQIHNRKPDLLFFIVLQGFAERMYRIHFLLYFSCVCNNDNLIYHSLTQPD